MEEILMPDQLLLRVTDDSTGTTWELFEVDA